VFVAQLFLQPQAIPHREHSSVSRVFHREHNLSLLQSTIVAIGHGQIFMYGLRYFLRLTKIITWGQIRPTKVWSSSGNPNIKKETSVSCCRHGVLLNHYGTLHFIGPVIVYWSHYNLLALLYFIGPMTLYWSHYNFSPITPHWSH